MNTRFSVLKTAWRLSLFCAFAFTDARVIAATTPARPNIVFICADDWRWDCLGVVQREQEDKARFPWLETPRLDELAKRSTRFRQSFVVNSLCSPGRACVLTGQYSHRNGIIGNSQPLPVETPTFAKQLQAAGYTTAYFGKFHMDGQRERPGFDYFASFVGQGRYVDCPILLNGKETPTQGWVDDVSTDYAIRFLEQRQEKPFFLWLGFKSPHGPRGGENLPERVRGLYADAVSRDVPNLEIPAIFNRNNGLAAPDRGQQRRKKQPYEGHRAYMRHITAIDHCVGRVLDTLTKSGQAENTVIIVSSDNGYYLGEHQLGDKRSAYDESLRVPLLIHVPGQSQASATCDAIVLNVDCGPTILDLAGAQPLAEAHGHSLRPLLDGESPKNWRDAFLYEYFKEPQYESPTVLAARTSTHKLITYPGHDDWMEVFDLARDPYELDNLATDAELAMRLRSILEEQMARVEFEMPPLPAERAKPVGKPRAKKTRAD